jgi:hypothetical protein
MIWSSIRRCGTVIVATTADARHPKSTEMARLTYDDIVRIRSTSALIERRGEKAWIVGITEDRTRFPRNQFPPGVIYTVEFEGGDSVDVHETTCQRTSNDFALLAEQRPPDSSLDYPRARLSPAGQSKPSEKTVAEFFTECSVSPTIHTTLLSRQ